MQGIYFILSHVSSSNFSFCQRSLFISFPVGFICVFFTKKPSSCLCVVVTQMCLLCGFWLICGQLAVYWHYDTDGRLPPGIQSTWLDIYICALKKKKEKRKQTFYINMLRSVRLWINCLFHMLQKWIWSLALLWLHTLFVFTLLIRAHMCFKKKLTIFTQNLCLKTC